MAREKKRKKSRRRGTAARANADLGAHIQSLGLETIEAYKSWCRQHGFTAALNKSWQERRQERAQAEKDKRAAQAEDEAMRHVEQLGLGNLEEYRAWCSEQRLSPALHKSPAQRRKELDLCQRLRSAATLSRKRPRRLEETIELICADQASEAELETETLRLVFQAFSGLEGANRTCLRDLLLHVEKRARHLLDGRPALDRLGQVTGNTYVEALGALARHGADWRQRPEMWRPESRNAQRQFASLVRFLLAPYDVPACLDSGFFRGWDEGAQRQQEWFKHVGGGQNIRTADLPLLLSKRMAHVFGQAPGRLIAEEGLRWAQVIGQDGSDELAEAIVETELGRSFANEDFWSTVVLFLVENGMLEPGMVGPIVDYINHQKFVPGEVALPGGGVVETEPPQPDYTMKGRSAVKLLGQVEEWHARLQRENRRPDGRWAHSDIADFAWEDEEEGLRWTIRQLTSKKELDQEGRAMNHCVASYAVKCQRGSKSVWSMQVADDEDRSARVVTIAVHNPSKNVVEVRGRFNAQPRMAAKNPRKKTLEKPYRELLARSGRVLRQWIEREEMGRTLRSY